MDFLTDFEGVVPAGLHFEGLRSEAWLCSDPNSRRKSRQTLGDDAEQRYLRVKWGTPVSFIGNIRLVIGDIIVCPWSGDAKPCGLALFCHRNIFLAGAYDTCYYVVGVFMLPVSKKTRVM